MEQKEKNNDVFIESVLKASQNIISITINNKPCIINAFFSMKLLEQYFAFYDKCKDYRIAFAHVVYNMQVESPKESPSISELLIEQDFVDASNDELFVIMKEILKDDGGLKTEFDKNESEDIFERFYVANKDMLDNLTRPLKDMFRKHQALVDKMIPPTLYSNLEKIQASISKVTLPAIRPELLGVAKVIQEQSLQSKAILDMFEQQKALANIIQPTQLKYMENTLSAIRPNFDNFARALSMINFDGFASAANAITKTNNIFATSTALQTLISSTPRVNFDLFQSMAPVFEKFKEHTEAIAKIQIPFDAISKAFANIDFSLLEYNKDWDERHDAFITYGWFYLNELPEELIDDVFTRQHELTQEDVDMIVVTHFRHNRCEALKRIVKSWNNATCFNSRKIVFRQALNAHSHKWYNLSVTMLTLHIEGVITDFARLALNKPKFKAENALKEIDTHMDEIPLTLTDWQIYSTIICEVQSVLTESFDLTNPETASNNSRHKIAHGHVIDKETEVASLKRFLYLNELYRLFTAIENELN